MAHRKRKRAFNDFDVDFQRLLSEFQGSPSTDVGLGPQPFAGQPSAEQPFAGQPALGQPPDPGISTSAPPLGPVPQIAAVGQPVLQGRRGRGRSPRRTTGRGRNPDRAMSRGRPSLSSTLAPLASQGFFSRPSTRRRPRSRGAFGA